MGEKLTKAQRDMLLAARDLGSALAHVGVRSRAGGAIWRMNQRLVERGLLEPDWPWAITPAGRALLGEKK